MKKFEVCPLADEKQTQGYLVQIEKNEYKIYDYEMHQSKMAVNPLQGFFTMFLCCTET